MSEPMSEPPRLSVVIPTAGRPQLLRRCLHALLQQSLPAQGFEVVVVDDGRDEATRRAVAETAALPGAPPLRYVLPPAGTRGPASARNAGWRAAAAPLIAFTDDDTIPHPHWLEEGEAALRGGAGSAPAAAWGHVSVPVSDPPTDNERNVKGLEGAVFVTANAFVRRAALELVGGFDERYARAWREDTDLYFALQQAGFDVAAAPRAVVVHPAREAPWGVSMRQQANMLFDALLFKKYPARYRALGHARPWRYYFIVSCTLAAIVAAAAGQPAAGAAALLLALGGVARVAWLRLRGTSHAPRHVGEMVLTSFALPFLSVYWRVRGALRWRVFFL